MSDVIRKVTAVIVSFNPNTEVFTKIIKKTMSQVSEIIIVDNGSDVTMLREVEILTHSYDNIKLIKLASNVGIASAQNIGIETALTLNCTHILFLDHDSIPDTKMVSCLLEVEEQLLENGVKVGAIGPTCVDRRTNTASGFVKKEKIFISRVYPDQNTKFIETDFLISSGTLVRANVLNDIGSMNDGYFIDHVDTEWCFRVTAKGYKLYGSASALLNHSLGECVVRVWCGRWREIPQHKPFRYYYIFRNTISMVKNTDMTLSWKITHLYRLFIFFAFFSLVGNQRMNNIKMIMRGIKDGFKNITGKYQD